MVNELGYLNISWFLFMASPVHVLFYSNRVYYNGDIIHIS